MASGQNFAGYNGNADPVYNSERLSKVLQIKYTQGVYGQLSKAHKEYEMIKKMKAGEEVGLSGRADEKLAAPSPISLLLSRR